MLSDNSTPVHQAVEPLSISTDKKDGDVVIVAMYLVGALLANKSLKAKIGNNMNEGMVAPYRKVLNDLKK